MEIYHRRALKTHGERIYNSINDAGISSFHMKKSKLHTFLTCYTKISPW